MSNFIIINGIEFVYINNYTLHEGRPFYVNETLLAMDGVPVQLHLITPRGVPHEHCYVGWTTSVVTSIVSLWVDVHDYGPNIEAAVARAQRFIETPSSEYSRELRETLDFARRQVKQ